MGLASYQPRRGSTLKGALGTLLLSALVLSPTVTAAPNHGGHRRHVKRAPHPQENDAWWQRQDIQMSIVTSSFATIPADMQEPTKAPRPVVNSPDDIQAMIDSVSASLASRMSEFTKDWASEPTSQPVPEPEDVDLAELDESSTVSRTSTETTEAASSTEYSTRALTQSSATATSESATSEAATTTKPSQSAKTKSSSPFEPVVGAGNMCVDRLDVLSMQMERPDSFNLLILAWKELQDMEESEDLSFFQLSRIHGAPFGPWQMPANGDYDYTQPYCTHASVLFLSWHRPYLALFEQTLYRKAVEIAATYSGQSRERFQKAAELVRLPYWDWSDPQSQSNVPDVLKYKRIWAETPDAQGNAVKTVIQNPLHSYTFKNKKNIQAFWEDFAVWDSTRRQPNSQGNSDEDLANQSVQSGFDDRRQSTYLAFSEDKFNAFGARIEAIHNTVHGSIGGGGHMTYSTYSSFDPLFWFHHCNVDRLMAMYQAAKPDNYIEAAQHVPTFANKGATHDTVDTPLYPFRHEDGSWWTSRDVASADTTFKLSYGYPEVPCGMSSDDAEKLQSHCNSKINELYAPAEEGVSAKSKRDDGEKIRVEWQAKISMDRHELPGSFRVYVFLGQPPRDYRTWQTSEVMIGSLTQLGMPNTKMGSKIIEDKVVLTNALKDVIRDSQGEDDILSYLKENLSWGVLSGGKPFNTTRLNTLKIDCISTEVKLPPRPEELPQKGEDAVRIDVVAEHPVGVPVNYNVVPESPPAYTDSPYSAPVYTPAVPTAVDIPTGKGLAPPNEPTYVPAGAAATMAIPGTVFLGTIVLFVLNFI